MKNISFIAFIIVFLTFGCNKSRTVNVTKNESKVLSEAQKENIENAFKTMPLIIKVKDEVNNRFLDFDVRNRTVSICKTWSFASPQTNTIYAQNNSLVVYVSSSIFNFGSSSSTSSVTAGNTTLNVHTLCLAVDASAYAAMFQTQTGQLPIDGISVVMGLDADFGLLQNSSSTNFGDYFHGLAYYLVYDFQASGQYPVIDWTTLTGTISSSNSFAMLFSFNQNNNGGFYFSKDGDINVSGGDMTFNGNYWGIEIDFSSITTSLSYNTYAGSGTMGCN